MNYKAFLIEAGKRMLHSGFTVGTWGNISVRDPETGYVYLTPSGMPYDTIVEDDIVVMDLDGNRIEGERKPTIEHAMHLGIMRNRPDVNAVVHAHPIYATSFAIAGIPLTQPIMPEAVIALGCVPIAEYGTPSTTEIPKTEISSIIQKE